MQEETDIKSPQSFVDAEDDYQTVSTRGPESQMKVVENMEEAESEYPSEDLDFSSPAW